jgi:hypothetical protein
MVVTGHAWTWVVLGGLVAACGSSAAPDEPLRRAPVTPGLEPAIRAPGTSRAVDKPTPIKGRPAAPTPLGLPIELECGSWTSRLPAGATFTGSVCEEAGGDEPDPATRVGVLGGQSSYQVVLAGCEIFVEVAGAGRPTPPSTSTPTGRTTLPRSRFGFARSRLPMGADGAAIIAVESSEHPELGVRARVSPAMSETEQASCGTVRDQVVETLANEAEWRAVLRPADGRVVLQLGSRAERLELRLPEGFVARNTGMAVDQYQTHHVIQRWPPPPMRAVDDSSFGMFEFSQRLMSDDAAVDTPAPRLDIVTAYAGGLMLQHAPRGETLQVGPRRLAFARVRDPATMTDCSTATEVAGRRSDPVITYFLCGAADLGLIEVLRSVELRGQRN